jgi:4-hydroxyphenylpyruvate dioxygenase
MPETRPASPLGLQGIGALHRYVSDLDAARHYFTQLLGFRVTAASTPAAEAAYGERSLLLEAGGCRVVCTQGVQAGAKASQYLARHPEGIAALSFEVEDVDAAHDWLDTHGGTPFTDPIWTGEGSSRCGSFAIATPLPDVEFRFVQRERNAPLLPGLEVIDADETGADASGFLGFDHITCNHQTMSPMLLWLEHVLGLRRDWHVEFHSGESGLRSVVMVDEPSGLTIANNEPFRPLFHRSQVSLYCDDQRGPGIQHVAILVEDILAAVHQLRERGVGFVHTPAQYYVGLEARLARAGVGMLEEETQDLQRLEILADGDAPGRYLLQIFMEDAARFSGSGEASPFFFELIQRKGCDGFGTGNFGALFDGVERLQAERRR